MLAEHTLQMKMIRVFNNIQYVTYNVTFKIIPESLLQIKIILNIYNNVFQNRTYNFNIKDFIIFLIFLY